MGTTRDGGLVGLRLGWWWLGGGGSCSGSPGRQGLGFRFGPLEGTGCTWVVVGLDGR